jgi:hypothetical protein
VIADILNAVMAACAANQPPTVGTPLVAPSPSNTGSGTVALDPSSQIFGTYNGLVQIVVGGAPGTATAQVALDNGNNVGNPNSQGNFDAVFTTPSSTPGYQVPLPSLSPDNLSQVLSGLVLNFSGSFNAGDSFSFQALPQILFLAGAEEVKSHDGLFPRVVFVPTTDSFEAPEDYAQGRDQRTQQRSFMTDVASFETHIWGIDYTRTEVLRDTVVNGIHFGLQATKKILRGAWTKDDTLGKAGRLYLLDWSVRKPLLQLLQDTIVKQPPTSLNLTTQFEDSP